MQLVTVIFLLAIVFALYTLAGYPVVLAVLARLRSREIKRQFRPRTVTVMLPVRNGEQWIAAKLDTILALDYPQELIDTLVVSDESTDGTDEIVRRYAAANRVRLIRVPRGGKAAALNAGLEQATGEILFFTDVRQRLAPDSLRQLVAAFGDPEVGAVSGELIILAGERRESADVGLYWKYEKWIRRTMSRIDSFHGVTGSIYALRRDLAAPIPPGTLNDDMYLPLRAFLKGYRIVFESRAVAEDFPTLLDAEFRRKVRTLAGVFQIIGDLPELVSPRNRMWFHFMSHKVFRLFLPYALIAAVVSSWFLPAPFGLMAMAAEAAVFMLAAFDPVLPSGSLLRRVSSPARTFIVMMAATVCAAAILFVPPARLWGETKVAEAKRGRAA
jgi:cellulose synthase/poly-beta-1,6-N-acetylglucosamine synthase-like glycosyltransferase